MTTKNWLHAAGITWKILVTAAAKRQTVTYSEIASAIHTNPLSVARALGPIQDYCLSEHLPPLTVLVIGKATGKPGNGFIAWDADDLSAGERAVYGFNWSWVENPFEHFDPQDSIETLADQLVEDPSSSKEVYAKVRARGMAQRVFRAALMRVYDHQCAICGLSFADALEGAHIIPWQEATARQKMHPSNGILLCSTHHRLFDSGWMTVSESLRVVFYDVHMKNGPYSKADRTQTVSHHGKPIFLPTDSAHQPDLNAIRRRHKIQSVE